MLPFILLLPILVDNENPSQFGVLTLFATTYLLLNAFINTPYLISLIWCRCCSQGKMLLSLTSAGPFKSHIYIVCRYPPYSILRAPPVDFRLPLNQCPHCRFLNPHCLLFTFVSSCITAVRMKKFLMLNMQSDERRGARK